MYTALPLGRAGYGDRDVTTHAHSVFAVSSCSIEYDVKYVGLELNDNRGSRKWTWCSPNDTNDGGKFTFMSIFTCRAFRRCPSTPASIAVSSTFSRLQQLVKNPWSRPTVVRMFCLGSLQVLSSSAVEHEDFYYWEKGSKPLVF